LASETTWSTVEAGALATGDVLLDRRAHHRLWRAGTTLSTRLLPARGPVPDPPALLTIVLIPMRMIVMFILPLDEHPGDNFFQGYWHILTDPAHIAVEITLMIVLDGILLGLLWPMIKTYVNARLQRQHAELDAEHGIHHHEDHVHVEPGGLVKRHEECGDHD
jgi:hypothetical protein